MRDFAKKNSHMPTRQNKQKKSSQNGRSFTLRKITLAMLLLILIVIFMLSFHHSQTKKEITPMATTTVQKSNLVVHDSSHTTPIVSDSPLSADKLSTVTNNKPMLSSALTSDAKDDHSTSLINNTDSKKSQPTIAKKKPEDQSLKFTFYDTLTNKTVEVDANSEKLKQFRYTYMLQIGSYRNLSDANATRAKLILAGLKPTITKIGDWYRLDVGPIYSQRDGDIAKHKVESIGISGSILRQVDKQEITEPTSE